MLVKSLFTLLLFLCATASASAKTLPSRSHQERSPMLCGETPCSWYDTPTALSLIGESIQSSLKPLPLSAEITAGDKDVEIIVDPTVEVDPGVSASFNPRDLLPLSADVKAGSKEIKVEVDPKKIKVDPGVKIGVNARMTNAERLRRGLPLKKPARRSRKVAGEKRTNHPQTSPGLPICYTAKVKVYRKSDHACLGYISKNYLNAAQAVYSDDYSKALKISFKIPYGMTAVSDVNIDTLNDNAAGGYGLFGLVQGRDNTDSNISPSSFHYLYFSNTAKTAANAAPERVGNSYTSSTGTQRTSESAVWSINKSNGALVPEWTNKAGAAAAPALTLFTSSAKTLYAGGDQRLFNSKYGSTTEIYFKLTDMNQA